MSKIKISYDKKDYILEYTREVVRRMEASKFNFDEIDTRPMTMIPMLIQGAFVHNHEKLKPAKIDMIFKAQPNKQGLVLQLGKMYRETVDSLFDDEEEVAEGNATWEII